tara:strand:- start:751 stop:1164 length:414 start_codon:yes stop_codon:yes gene_type:complete
MEYVALLIISILGLALLVVAVVSVASNLDKQNTFLRKTNENQIKIRRQKQLSKEEKKKLRNKFRDGRPNSIQPIKTVQKYKYPEATRRLKEESDRRLKELELKKKEEEDKNKIYEGKRGGRYTKDKTKDGRPYRRYF